MFCVLVVGGFGYIGGTVAEIFTDASARVEQGAQADDNAGGNYRILD